jgi:hypothetical protein
MILPIPDGWEYYFDMNKGYMFACDPTKMRLELGIQNILFPQNVSEIFPLAGREDEVQKK